MDSEIARNPKSKGKMEKRKGEKRRIPGRTSFH